MADAFVDALYGRLEAARQKTITDAAETTQSRQRVAEAARIWWDEFCQVLEHKVDAWNTQSATSARLTYTPTPPDAVVLRHHRADAELRLTESRIVLTGRIGDTQPRESPFVMFQVTRGSVAVVLSGVTVKSPSEAADQLLEPLLTRAFAG
jgi:hypothetical protein